MREIKFRVFDTRSKKMITDEVCFQLALGLNGSIKAGISEDVLMQFTGLTDKNGVEIFEGDVVRNPQNKIGEVVFYEGKFCLKSFRKNDTIWFMPLDIGFMKNKEVIGNKFENPELL
jgi:uncharacterized phage protein (TIGR01671 family)